jgi:hypothetical protein
MDRFFAANLDDRIFVVVLVLVAVALIWGGIRRVRRAKPLRRGTKGE